MMKKFLIMLMIVAMASFLFVGCFTEPDEPIEPDEPVVKICPTVTVASEVEIAGKNYIKGGKREITVTFAVPTEPISVYVGLDLKNNIWPLPGVEVVMYANADKTVYTGDFAFTKSDDKDCNEAYIYVEICETCDYCKYPYTVDTNPPYAKLKVKISGKYEDCPCGGCCMTISSVVEEDVCDPDVVCCGDGCSGLASWSFRLFDEFPWSACCDTGCEEAILEDSGTDCPIKITTDCLDPGVYYFVGAFSDEVGNEVNVADAFEIKIIEEKCSLFPIADPDLPEACDYEPICWSQGDGTMIIIIDPSETMPEVCEELCVISPSPTE